MSVLMDKGVRSALAESGTDYRPVDGVRSLIRLPVVILTGHGGSQAVSEGVAAVLLKPAASGELVRTIRSVLDRARVAPFV